LEDLSAVLFDGLGIFIYQYHILFLSIEQVSKSLTENIYLGFIILGMDSIEL